MARNIEIKAVVADADAIRRRVAPLATAPCETLEQTDTFFIVPRGRLKVRQFPDGSGELISYERPDQAGPKESVYTRVACRDARVLVDALRRVLPLRGIVVKRREVYHVGRTRVHLDVVERLGVFVEIEVVLGDEEPSASGEREARTLLASLDIPERGLMVGAYIDLLEAAAPRDP